MRRALSRLALSIAAVTTVPVHATQVFLSGFEARQITVLELADFQATTVGTVIDLDFGTGIVETHVRKGPDGTHGELFGVRFIGPTGEDLALLLDAQGRPILGTSNRDLRRIEFSNYTHTGVDIRAAWPDRSFDEELQVPYESGAVGAGNTERALHALLIASSAIAAATQIPLGASPSDSPQKAINPVLGAAFLYLAYLTWAFRDAITAAALERILQGECQQGETQQQCAERVCRTRSVDLERRFRIDDTVACENPQQKGSSTADLRCRLSPEYDPELSLLDPILVPGRCVSVNGGPGAQCSGISCATPYLGNTFLKFRSSGAFCHAGVILREPLSDGSYRILSEIQVGASTDESVSGVLRVRGSDREVFSLNSGGQVVAYTLQANFYEPGGHSETYAADCLTGDFTIRNRSNVVTESGNGATCPGPASFSRSNPFEGFWK